VRAHAYEYARACTLFKTLEHRGFSLVVTVELVCVSMAASWLNLQISTSELIFVSRMYIMRKGDTRTFHLYHTDWS
jgi:hypothetical protein